MRQRGGMKLSEKQRYKNEDRRQRFQEQYLRHPRQSMSDFYTITFTGKKIESRKRLLHRSCRPRVYRFADKSSDDEEHYGRPQTRRNIDNDSEHASRDRASIDSVGQSR
ncbi:hypothetical protein J6590_055946 [Homalodisca vitripennis]|nr:hypothetical protein J6590_055946 [Homalodisca vitripennis]